MQDGWDSGDKGEQQGEKSRPEGGGKGGKQNERAVVLHGGGGREKDRLGPAIYSLYGEERSAEAAFSCHRTQEQDADTKGGF